MVAAVAAYASYDHQRAFALEHGAHGIAAAVWPLSVDGLLILASVALLDPALSLAREWVRLVVRAAFTAGICVSLAANVAAAGGWNWAGVLVAGWPPVALLLSAEILIHSTSRDDATETSASRTASPGQSRPFPVTSIGGGIVSPEPGTEPAVPHTSREGLPATEARLSGPGVRRGAAQRVMWEHYRAALAAGRTPTGAELDRIAGTHDYGRAVLARWRRIGRIPTTEPDETVSRVDTEATMVPAARAGTPGSVPNLSGDPVRPFETRAGAADRPGPAVPNSRTGPAGESGRAAA
ncbi:DUF2637 domain-containing protein [Amycolatopsis sp. NBC_01488]|uniref:DUF2637 domain-containing protein n=1 Tax=Amycolatopsis sp. NBC_01488 TaxID=2903563 RepID=UPI002E28EE27|nr:DUF2637 domain-containing protein [Amycolatopsis sp. NBC_01488]